MTKVPKVRELFSVINPFRFGFAFVRRPERRIFLVSKDLEEP